MLLDLILVAALLLVLVKSADFLEAAFVHFSSKIGFSPFVVGFTIVAFISSLPEFSVALSSASHDVPELSIGNLLGATLVLLTLVIGSNSIKHGKLPFYGSFSFNYLLLSLLIILLLVTSLLDRELALWEGIMLIVAYSLTCLFIVSKTHHPILHAKVAKHKNSDSTLKFLLKGILGMILLLLSANLLVDRCITLVEQLGVSSNVIGLLMLGLGTNLPEITLLIRSSNLAEDKLAAGNFIGSATVNVPIMGLLAILSPHQITGFQSFIPVLACLAFTVIVFAFLAFTGRAITRKEGWILIGIYLLWLLLELTLVV